MGQGNNNQQSVLIVDDVKSIQHSLGRLLAKMGFGSIDFASSGAAAHEKLADKPYDIIFLDIDLSDSDGKTVLGEITNQYSSKVVMCSGHNSLENVKQTWEMGAKGFISKPFNEQNVKNVVRRLQFC